MQSSIHITQPIPIGAHPAPAVSCQTCTNYAETGAPRTIIDRLGVWNYVLGFFIAIIVPVGVHYAAGQVFQDNARTRIERLESDTKEAKAGSINRGEFEGLKREIDVKFDAQKELLNLIYNEVKDARK